MLTTVLLFLSGLAVTWAPDYYSFVAMQFVVGAVCKGSLVLWFVFGRYNGYS